MENNIPIDWEYYSFEIDRVTKEFDFLTYFLHKDYNVLNIRLPEGITRKGSNMIELSADYLRGYLLDDNFKSIKIHEDLIPLIKECYQKRIVPLFGEYSSNGIRLTKGLINFKEGRDNPTGLYKDLLEIANKEGVITKDKNGMFISYKPNDPKKLKIVIVDHVRKFKTERGFQMKQTIDKASEYMVILVQILN